MNSIQRLTQASLRKNLLNVDYKCVLFLYNLPVVAVRRQSTIPLLGSIILTLDIIAKQLNFAILHHLSTYLNQILSESKSLRLRCTTYSQLTPFSHTNLERYSQSRIQLQDIINNLYIYWYNNGRIQEGLGYLSPNNFYQKLALKTVAE